MLDKILTPVLLLICWTFIVMIWLYATRIPAMRALGIRAGKLKRKGDLDALPVSAQQVADNFNHLHEQPTVFYALAFYSQIMGTGDSTNVALAWAYVGLRVAHSLVQCTFNYVPLRFLLFVTSSSMLMAIAVRNLLVLLAAP